MQYAPIRWTLAVIAAVIAGIVAFRYVPEPLPELTRDELLAEARAGHIRRIEIEDQDIILGENSVPGEFRSPLDRRRDAGLADELRALGVEVRYTRSPPGI
jgi:hypothetical protein